MAGLAGAGGSGGVGLLALFFTGSLKIERTITPTLGQCSTCFTFDFF